MQRFRIGGPAFGPAFGPAVRPGCSARRVQQLVFPADLHCSVVHAPALYDASLAKVYNQRYLDPFLFSSSLGQRACCYARRLSVLCFYHIDVALCLSNSQATKPLRDRASPPTLSQKSNIKVISRALLPGRPKSNNE